MKRLLVQLKRRYKGVIKRILAYIRYIRRFRAIRQNGQWVMEPRYEALMYDAMNLDINNTCNLRCRFCFNAFAEEPCYMSEEVFKKVLSLFPLIRPITKGGAGIFFSCIYEPTMSPHFLKFLTLIPREGRKGVFFTSNFCKPVTEEEFQIIFSANLHHINISVETFQAQRYQELCSSIQFDSFYQNMERLSEVYSKRKGRKPKLYYITMVLKANREELPFIVSFCSKKLHAARHDLRTPFIAPDAHNNEWNMEQLMDLEECGNVRTELEALRLPILLDIHAKEEFTTHLSGENRSDENKPSQYASLLARQLEEIGFCTNPEYLFIRFHPSGMCTFSGTKENCMISDMEDVSAFFQQKLYQLYERRAKAFLCAPSIFALFSDENVKELSARVVFDEVTANSVYLFLQGRISLPEVLEEEVLFLLKEGKSGQVFLAVEKSYPDWTRKADRMVVGFTTYIAREVVIDGLTDLKFMIVGKRNLKPLFSFHYPYGILWKEKHKRI